MSKIACILLTNDDGHDAPGLSALYDALVGLGRLIVVAPDHEMSAASHALTLRRPLRVRKTGDDRYRVDGTPTDCVHLGMFNLTDGVAPDLVISGINRGLNLGDDVTYSGTVAGALEGTLLHVPSIAVSAARQGTGEASYTTAAGFARQLAERVLRDGLPEGVFLNVNVPSGEPEGVRVTRQGTRTYRSAVVERLDPSGRPYYWVAGAETVPSGESDGDHAAIDANMISVSPLSANLTHDASLAMIDDWCLELS